MSGRRDVKATVALVVAVFAAVVAVTALAVLFWMGGAGGASQDGSTPALQTSNRVETDGAAAKPVPEKPMETPQDAKQALERLRAAAETLAGTAETLAEMQINAMLLKLSGLQQEVESLRSGSAGLAGVLQTLTQALDGPMGNIDTAAIAQAASALEHSNTTLNDEMAALKQAKQNKDLEAIGQGLERMTRVVEDATAIAQDAMKLVQQ